MWQQKVERFVTNSNSCDIPLVLVTSGGTKVSIEKNEVRSLENFSTGFRGAKSVELFIELGYRCIFLYRKGHNIYYPYTFSLKNELSNEIDDQFLLNLNLKSNLNTNINNKIMKDQEMLRSVIKSNKFLSIGFDTVDDYLIKLEMITKILNHIKEKSLVYLAAAVSDFYIPSELMSTHKIQSRQQTTTEATDKKKIKEKHKGNNGEDKNDNNNDGNNINNNNLDGNVLWKPIFHPVKKVLGDLAIKWAPKAFVISFKLETDSNILINKAKSAIKKYHVDGVVCNLLSTRRDHVQILTRKNKNHINNDDNNDDNDTEIRNIHRSNDEDCIEIQLVHTIKQMHELYMNYHNSPYSFTQNKYIHQDQEEEEEEIGVDELNDALINLTPSSYPRLRKKERETLNHDIQQLVARVLCVMSILPMFIYLK